jgi:hypothetical protein
VFAASLRPAARPDTASSNPTTIRFPRARSAASIRSGLEACLGFSIHLTTVSLTPSRRASSVFAIPASLTAMYSASFEPSPAAQPAAPLLPAAAFHHWLCNGV